MITMFMNLVLYMQLYIKLCDLNILIPVFPLLIQPPNTPLTNK